MRTRGRYYFAEPGTPHAPGSHIFGSRNWHDRNWRYEVALGELPDAQQVWDNGARPALLPEARQLGSAQCLSGGELAYHQVSPSNLIDGFPRACFSAATLISPLWGELSSYQKCPTQRIWARVIDWLRDFQTEHIAELFLAWLGPAVVITFHEQEGNFPPFVTGVHAEFSFAAIYGTNSAQQIALQALQFIRAPTDFGLYGTLPLWYDASTHIASKLDADGANPDAPIFLAGHSYGGCAALNLVARYRHAKPNRSIRYITYGVPKIGDARMVALVERAAGINVANDNDIATVLPPDYTTLLPIMLALGYPGFVVYVNWQRPPNQVRLDADGSMHANALVLPDYATLFAVLQAVLLNQQLDPITGHYITTYYERLALRCPEANWPVFEEIIVIENGPNPIPAFMLTESGEELVTQFGIALRTNDMSVKITELPALVTEPAANDLTVIVDVSDLSEGPNGTTKKIETVFLLQGTQPASPNLDEIADLAGVTAFGAGVLETTDEADMRAYMDAGDVAKAADFTASGMVYATAGSTVKTGNDFAYVEAINELRIWKAGSGAVVSGSGESAKSITIRGTNHATKGPVILNDLGGDVIVGGDATASKVVFMEPSASGVNKTTLRARAQTADCEYQWPAALPTRSDSPLVVQTDGTMDFIGPGTIILAHQQPLGTHGGGAVAGGWFQLPVNVELIDTGNDCVLAANLFTLQPGRYRLRAWQTFLNTAFSVIRLVRTADGVVFGVSPAVFTAGGFAQPCAHLCAFLDLAVATQFHLEYQVGVAVAVFGLGGAAGFGVENFCVVDIAKYV